jgi:hypothetical protein
VDNDVQIIVSKGIGRASVKTLTPVAAQWAEKRGIMLVQVGADYIFYIEEEQVQDLEAELKEVGLRVRKL